MPTLTSSTGGAERETRIVSPMPSAQQRAEGDGRLDRALERRAGLGDAEVQRVVARCGEQSVGADHHDRVVVLDRDLDVAEAVLLEQGALPQRRLDQGLGGGLAVLGQQPLVQRAGVDADADRYAGVAGGLGDLARPCRRTALMLPGLTRTAAQPASIAANTYFGWKWMSAMTGICDLRAMAGSASASSWRGHGDPDDLAARRGELGDLLEGGVDVGGQRGRHRLHGHRGVRRRRARRASPCRR